MIRKDPRTRFKCKGCGLTISRRVWDFMTTSGGSEDTEYCADCGLKRWVERHNKAAAPTKQQKRR